MTKNKEWHKFKVKKSKEDAVKDEEAPKKKSDNWYNSKKLPSMKEIFQEHLNQLHGGKGENLNPDDVDQDELNVGIKEEMEEHTNDENIARQICLDHLAEDPHYYSKLKKAGL